MSVKEGSSTPQIAMKRLTLAQVDENRKKGLCFKCDEPYTIGHKCKQKSFMMIEHEDLESEAEDEEILLKPKGMEEPEISFQAMRVVFLQKL